MGNNQVKQESLTFRLVQMDSKWEDIDANLSCLETKFLKNLGDVDLVVLPEMFATGFSMNIPKIKKLDGDKVEDSLLNLANKYKISFLAGIAKQNGHGEGFSNQAVLLNPNEEPLHYHKRHLFFPCGEDQVYQAGNERVIFDFKGWRLQPIICYDLRFPVWCRNQDDTDILVCLANFPSLRSEIWLHLLKARAIENQVFSIGVNRVGEDGNHYHYSGDTCVFGPTGSELSMATPETEMSIDIRLKKSDLIAARENFPVLKDRDLFDFI